MSYFPFINKKVKIIKKECYNSTVSRIPLNFAILSKKGELLLPERDCLRKTASYRLKNKGDELFLSPEDAAVVGHGIKSPLARIVALSELLLKELPGSLNEEQKEYIQDIYNNGFLLLNNINSLLTITRSEAGFQKLNLGPFNIKDIVESVVVRVDSVAISRGTQILIHIPDNLPIVYCDRYKIEQALYNLLDNAMKFTFDGTITISVRELPDRTIEFSVSDTGVGIKEKNLSKVFDKFFTEKSALNPGGSGLGLTVVREIVQLHKGRVWLESQEGQGTTVSFVIPNHAISGKIEEKKELASRARVRKRNS